MAYVFSYSSERLCPGSECPTNFSTVSKLKPASKPYKLAWTTRVIRNLLIFIFIKPHQNVTHCHQQKKKEKEKNREATKMGKKEALLILLIVAVLGNAIGIKEEEEEEWWREREEEKEFGSKERFLMVDSKKVIETEAGEMRVMRGPISRILDKAMHIGFITMEPKSLFVPQYLDSTLILFVRRGNSLFSLNSFLLACIHISLLQLQEHTSIMNQ